MAVVKKWAVDEQETGYPQKGAYKKESQNLNGVLSKVAVAAADTDASIYGLAALPGGAVVKDIKVGCTAITAGTDYDIGLYRVAADGGIGAVIDADMFLDGQDLSSAKVRGSEVTGISALSVANSDLTLAQLANSVSGVTELDARYAICLTANTVGSAAGTVIVLIDVINA